jgi:hypothetical protein
MKGHYAGLGTLICMVVMTMTASAQAPEGQEVVHPQDTGEALCNPGMGWVFHYYDNNPANYGSRLEPSDTVDEFPGLTVIYLRIPWSYVEPEEGRFNWAVVDAPAQRWIDKGKQVAFRFTCSESWMRWATPEWVMKAGANGYNFRPGQGVVEDGPFWEPDYDDPIFLEKLGNFLAAAAKRYDGNPEVAFIDVGSFGVWGEGHTFASTRLPFSGDTVRRHLDLHRKHFPRTLLAANDDFSSQGRGDDTIDYAREKGLTLRDDSILVQGGKNAYFHANFAQGIWPNLPVILESEHYGGSRDRGCWQDGSLYLQAVEDYHASYASIHWWPREFLQECGDLIHRINQRLGYRLQLTEASWPGKVKLGEPMQLTCRWRNAGVAPCLPGGFPCVTLKDRKGGIVATYVDEAFDMRSLPVAAPGEAPETERSLTVSLPYFAQGGTYDVYVSVGSRTGTPQIALPLPEGDGHRRYRLGTMQVQADYDVTVGALQAQEQGWSLPLKWTVHAAAPAGVRPFCHFDRAGRILFQGNPASPQAAAVLETPGESSVDCLFLVPAEAAGGTFEVWVGLFVPSRLGRSDERLTPDRGNADRRILIGTLEVDADGQPTFIPREH